MQQKIKCLLFWGLFFAHYAGASLSVRISEQSPLVARSGASVLKLADGKILITGGTVAASSGHGPVSTVAWVQKIDPASGKAETLPNLPVALGQHSSTLLPNGDVFVVGTQPTSGSGPLTSLAFMYEEKAKAWVKVKAPEFARREACLIRWSEDEIAVVGGEADPALATSAIEIYSKKTSAWHRAATFEGKWSKPTCVRTRANDIVLAQPGDHALIKIERSNLKVSRFELPNLISSQPVLSEKEDGDIQVGVAVVGDGSRVQFTLVSSSFASSRPVHAEISPRLYDGRLEVKSIQIQPGRFLTAVEDKETISFFEMNDGGSTIKRLGLTIGRPKSSGRWFEQRNNQFVYSNGSATNVTVTVAEDKAAGTAWPPLGIRRDQLAAQAFGQDQFLLFGGQSEGVLSKKVELLKSSVIETIADLPYGLLGPSVKNLPDGNLLIFGGTDGHHGDSIVFNLKTRKFETPARLNNPRFHFASVVLPNGRVVVAGGILADPVTPEDSAIEFYKWRGETRPREFIRQVEVWSPATNKWEVIGLSEPRIGPILIPIDANLILITGGLRDSGAGYEYPEHAELIDLNAKTVKQLPTPSLPIAFTNFGGRADIGWVAAGGLELCAPGKTCVTQPSTRGWAFNSKAEVVSGGENILSRPVAYAQSVFAPNGYLIISGGSNSLSKSIVPSNQIEMVHYSLKGWARGPDLNIGRLNHGFAVSPSGAMLVAGGRSEEVQESTVEHASNAFANWVVSKKAASPRAQERQQFAENLAAGESYIVYVRHGAFLIFVILGLVVFARKVIESKKIPVYQPPPRPAARTRAVAGGHAPPSQTPSATGEGIMREEVIVAILNGLLLTLVATHLQMKMLMVNGFDYSTIRLTLITIFAWNLGLAGASILGALPLWPRRVLASFVIAGSVGALPFFIISKLPAGTVGFGEEVSGLMAIGVFLLFGFLGLFAHWYGRLSPKIFLTISEKLLTVVHSKVMAFCLPNAALLLCVLVWLTFFNPGSGFYLARTVGSQPLVGVPGSGASGPSGQLPPRYAPSVEICEKHSGADCKSGFASAYRDMRWCNGLSGFLLEECYLSVAIMHTNADLCELLQFPALQASCFGKFAVETKTAEVCDRIKAAVTASSCAMVQARDKAACLSDAGIYEKQRAIDVDLCKRATKLNPGLCFEQPGERLPFDSSAQCIMNMAIGSKNSSLCGELQKSRRPRVESACRIAAAASTTTKETFLIQKRDKSPLTPELLGYAELCEGKARCFNDLSLAFRNPAFCDAIKFPRAKDFCYSLLAAQNSDSEICGKIGDPSLLQLCQKQISR